MIPLKSASSLANRAVESLLALLGISMALIVIIQVICRYGLNHSLFWSEELARILLIWLTFLGASAAYYRRVHPGIDILTSRLSERAGQVCKITAYLLSLPFFAVMVYYGTAFSYFTRLQISAALGIPKWIIYAAVPVSGVLLSLHCLMFLLAELKRGNHHDR